jgi:glycine hydroxymethyltransferase
MMTTTHKSLRGPRGALILSKGIVSNPLKAVPQTKENIPTLIDRGIFPGLQGGPHMNTIAAIAVALEEAEKPDFKIYAQHILDNAQMMASAFIELGYTLVTGGTDNHLIVIDLRPLGMDGEIAQKALDEVGISVSKSPVPHDDAPAYKPSGLRLGTPAMTTRGATPSDFREIVALIDETLNKKSDIETLKQKVKLIAEKLKF